MADENKLERLLAGKSETTQNRLRKAIYEAHLTDDDALWPFLEVLDVYSSEMRANALSAKDQADRAAEINDGIQKNLRTSIARQFKQIRDASFAAYAEKMDGKLVELDKEIEEKNGLLKHQIEVIFGVARDGAVGKIEEQEQVFSEKANKEIEKILTAARKNKTHPLARLVAGVLGFSLLFIAASVFASLFLIIGHEAALGNTDVLPGIWAEIVRLAKN